MSTPRCLSPIAALAALLLAPCAARGATVHAPRAAIDCEAAGRLTLPGARITATRAVVPLPAARARGERPHCVVLATVDVETHILALLPDDWNGRFVMGGGGGFVGTIDNQSAAAVHEGYATVGTDAGHTGSGFSAVWALDNERRLVEYGHRAVHRTAEVTKLLIAAYYGRAPEKSYFVGCSNGGRQALMEAQRYPADFDGIVSIAPAYNFLAVATNFIRNLQAQYPDGDFRHAVITPTVLQLVARKVVERCDALDGVRDGSLEDPEACTFTPASLAACANDVPGAECVTKAQRAALTAIGSPLRAGAVRYPGQPYGDEADPSGIFAWITGPVPVMLAGTGGAEPTVQGAFGIEFFRYFVYSDPTWRYVGYDLTRAARDGARADSLVSATDTDLSAFQARGGKLLLAHGWSDPALNARATIEYFTAMRARTPDAASFTRLFLLPGVLHCAGGSGCDKVDWTAAIRRWVEEGTAPSLIEARKESGGKVVRTHPLCAYPMRAHWDGTGSAHRAESYACR